MSLAGVALDMQVRQLRWTRSDHGKRVTYAMAQSGFPDDTPEDVARMARVYYEGQTFPLDRGETFAVTSEIVDLIESAAQSLPDFDLRPYDVPAEFGFVYLERPLIMYDDTQHHRPLVVKAIGWTFGTKENADGSVPEGHQGIVLTIWTDPKDPRDHMFEDVQGDDRLHQLMGPLTFLGLAPHDWNTPLSHIPSNKDGMSDAGPIAFSAEGDATGTIFDINPKLLMVYELYRFMYSLWRFVHEPFIDARAILPDRPAQKRAIRAGRPTTEVRVVRLRKRDQHHHDGDHLDDDDVLWSHRWLVKGHWRNQWYPSERRHAPKWISGYVKGPEHLPLLVKDTVFQVDR